MMNATEGPVAQIFSPSSSEGIVSDSHGAALSIEKVRQMIHACTTNDMSTIQELLKNNHLYCSQQDIETGISPLMMASQYGPLELVQFLLDYGAPWNALDRQGKCAGNYATDAEQWNIVDLLVDWATRSELILGQIQRTNRESNTGDYDNTTTTITESSTKPSYLQQSLQYNDNGTALLDADCDAVMMEWERPIMKAHAQILLGDIIAEPNKPRRVLNVGFGMGIIDTILQDEYQPTQHYIIEAHPDVYKKMTSDGWNTKPNVTICYGRWQDIVPQLIQQKIEFDGIFFDTYGEHCMDMEDFHSQIVHLLAKPHGVYSFFNGLAPDNIFFHGVACQVIKLQLNKLGFDTEFFTCQIEIQNINNAKVWQGIRRKYWHDRDVYYLPRITWNQEYLGRKTKALQGSSDHVDETMDFENDDSDRISPLKRQRRVE